MRKIDFQKESGFTIIEVIIVIFIFSLMMGALLDLFDWHNKVFFMQKAETEAAGSARQSMNDMTKFISQASQVISSHTFNGVTRTTSSNVLVLQLPSYGSAGDLITNTYDYIAFYKNGNALYEAVEPGTGSARKTALKQLATNASILTFTTDNSSNITQSSKVTVDLQTQATKRGAEVSTVHDIQTILLRNH